MGLRRFFFVFFLVPKAAVRVRTGKSDLEWAIRHLYLLELSCDGKCFLVTVSRLVGYLRDMCFCNQTAILMCRNYHMSRAPSGKIAPSDSLICWTIFSCNARLLYYGKMTGKTSKRGRFESAS